MLNHVDRTIVARTAKLFLARGCLLRIDHADEFTTDLETLLKQAFACDDERLQIIGQDGLIVYAGVIQFIYDNGNGGWDVISDYSVIPLIEEVMNEVTSWTDEQCLNNEISALITAAKGGNPDEIKAALLTLGCT